MEPKKASIFGTKEIAVPVTFGILTTAVAFLPLLAMDGTRFAFIAQQMPIVVIPVLLMSLVESKFVLPSHMSHISPRKEDEHLGFLGRTQQSISRALERFVESYYRPFLKRCVNNRGITLALIIGLSAIVVAAINFGQVRTSQFPRIQGDSVTVNLTMPESTGIETTEGHINNIVQHFKTVQKKYMDEDTGESVITHIKPRANGCSTSRRKKYRAMCVA